MTPIERLRKKNKILLSAIKWIDEGKYMEDESYISSTQVISRIEDYLRKVHEALRKIK